MTLTTSLKNLLISCLFVGSTATSAAHESIQYSGHAKHIILYVWDGLRADAVTKNHTPNLYALMNEGASFPFHHSSYPTVTMMNAASFATGARAGKTGFYGNKLWHPESKGTNSFNTSVDYQQPVFTEDYKILQALDHDALFLTDTLFSEAQKNNLKTVTIGKSGPAFMQDYLSKGKILDEEHISPLSFAKQLQKHGYPLPKHSPFAFNAGALTLAPNNGDPTSPTAFYYLSDGVTSDSSNHGNSPYSQANEYMMNMYLTAILPRYKPQLSVIWMRAPDSIEHTYGPGTPVYYNALEHNDKMLGMLIQQLKKQGIYKETDIIVSSDHAHSSISGSLQQFPLRQHEKNAIATNGASVSGAIRTADLLTRAGFRAFDGEGCRYNPIMSGITRTGKPLYKTKIDKTGKICGKKYTKYTTPSYKVPYGKLPDNAIIVAPNGGSVYFYVPSHNKLLVAKLVRFLQSREFFGALFIDTTHYNELPGTLPLTSIHIQDNQNRAPDIIMSFSYDANAKIHGLPGIEYADSTNERGTHGSFSPVDIHNFLAAHGPDFNSTFVDDLPTGNVDVAPTIAYLLSLPFESEGRVLHEALTDNKQQHNDYKVSSIQLKSKESAVNLDIYNVLQQKLKVSSHQTIVYAKVLSLGKKSFIYFDAAKGKRQ